jgi:hypothetical protein
VWVARTSFLYAGRLVAPGDSMPELEQATAAKRHAMLVAGKVEWRPHAAVGGEPTAAPSAPPMAVRPAIKPDGATQRPAVVGRTAPLHDVSPRARSS